MNNFFQDSPENQSQEQSQSAGDSQTTDNFESPKFSNLNNETHQEYQLSNSSKKNYGIILLLAVCGIGILGVYLFGMKQKSEPTEESKAAESTVDVVIAKLSEGKNSKSLDDTAQMVQTFYDYPLNQQVSVDELKKNPFSRLTENEVSQTAVVPVKEKKKDIKAELQKKIEKINLQAVIQASGGAKCMIDGEVLGIGQVIGDEFTITQIQSGSVTLESKGHTFTLEI